MSSVAATAHIGEAEHPSAPPSTCKFGMIMFLISEGMLFAGLLGAYIVLRWTENGFPWQAGHAWPPNPDLPALPWEITGINTLFLVASSITYHFAEERVKKGKSGLVLLFFTIVLGATFVGIQCYEWWHLHHEGLWFNTGGVYGSTFFAITGFHGVHVAIGVLLIIWCFLRQLFTRCYTPERHVSLQNVALYWHFVDVVWIFLFVLLYLV